MFAVNGHWFGAVGAAFLAVSAVGKIMEIRATGKTVEDAVPAESAGLARTDSSPTVAPTRIAATTAWTSWSPAL